MATHARLKDGFTEDEKYHTFMRWLIWFVLLLILGVVQGNEETFLLVLDGMCLSAEFWIKDVSYQVEVLQYWASISVTIEI